MSGLEELEVLILKWHLKKGLKLFEEQKESDSKWTFKTVIESDYKRKQLLVISIIEGKEDQVIYVDESNIIDMYNKAKIFFNKGI